MIRFLGLQFSASDFGTLVLSAAMLIVTIISNILLQIYWNRKKLNADLKSRSRISWIQDVRKFTAELIGTYYEILSYHNSNERSGNKTDLKSLLSVTQTKTQLLMLYFGFEEKLSVDEFNIIEAKKELLIYNKKCFLSRKGNCGKNKWISGLLQYVNECFEECYNDSINGSIDCQIEEAETVFEENSRRFYRECHKHGFLYDNVNAQYWKEGQTERQVDLQFLKAINRLNSLDKRKRNLVEYLAILRESVSIYLKTEWNRAKKGK